MRAWQSKKIHVYAHTFKKGKCGNLSENEIMWRGAIPICNVSIAIMLRITIVTINPGMINASFITRTTRTKQDTQIRVHVWENVVMDGVVLLRQKPMTSEGRDYTLLIKSLTIVSIIIDVISDWRPW